MKSIKNHLSLVVALFSILFSIQILTIADRSIEAYKSNLAHDYTVIVISKDRLKQKNILNLNSNISSIDELSPDKIIKRLNSGMDKKNLELIKLSLPKFYKIHLKTYPDPSDIKQLRRDLFRNSSIIRVEDFSDTHDITYKLLLLFRSVVNVFSAMIIVVTTLLIFKELKIWQFQHSERMNIMGLFGAAVWLRSAILFRLAIVDALIASFLIFITFTYINSSYWILQQFHNIGIKIVIFDFTSDGLMLSGIALLLSLMLASLIVIGHKEEV